MFRTGLLLHAFCLAHCYIDLVLDYNYTILSAVPDSYDHIALLNNLKKNGLNLKLEFLNEPKLKKKVSIGIPTSRLAEIQDTLKLDNLFNRISVYNLKREILRERFENSLQYRPHMEVEQFALNQYHQLQEIEAYVRNLAKAYPHLVSIRLLGHTYYNRNIFAVQIGKWSKKRKPIIYIDAGIHAREWISHASAVYIISKLVLKYKIDPVITELLDTYDWYIIPVLNPDGYVHTWTKNRLWRKNLAKVAPYTPCVGVDANRNFPVGFGSHLGEGSSNRPCAEDFMGLAPFSESESRAVKKFTEANMNHIKAVFSLHSYGQMWMFPWSYLEQNTSDYAEMSAAAEEAVEALQSVRGTKYEFGPVYDVIYPANGVSIDWQYNVTRTPYVYAVELSDTGFYSFQLPRKQIIPTAKELWAAIESVALRIKKKEPVYHEDNYLFHGVTLNLMNIFNYLWSSAVKDS